MLSSKLEAMVLNLTVVGLINARTAVLHWRLFRYAVLHFCALVKLRSSRMRALREANFFEG